MSEGPENLVLVYLRRLDGNVQDLQAGQAEILTRLTRLEEGQARSRRDQASDAETLAHLQAQMDRLREELVRVKRRLDLVD